MIDQLNVSADARLKTLFRRRPRGVRLNERRSSTVCIGSLLVLPVWTVPFEEGLEHGSSIENQKDHAPRCPREWLKKGAQRRPCRRRSRENHVRRVIERRTEIDRPSEKGFVGYGGDRQMRSAILQRFDQRQPFVGLVGEDEEFRCFQRGH